ncbi:MAG: hypothetical protein ACLGXA_08800 [Acidobacteriota bacterium]
MKTANGVYRAIAMALVMLLGTPLGAIASAQERSAQQQAQNATSQPVVPQGRAEVPGQPISAEVASLPESPTPAAQSDSSAQQQQPAPAPPLTAQQPQQQGTQSQPMGTAAAPAEPAGGIAATRPAGAAIAPAKQKRTHTLLIRWSLLIGAAVAVGTVVGLSSASQNRP